MDPDSTGDLKEIEKNILDYTKLSEEDWIKLKKLANILNNTPDINKSFKIVKEVMDTIQENIEGNEDMYALHLLLSEDDIRKIYTLEDWYFYDEDEEETEAETQNLKDIKNIKQQDADWTEEVAKYLATHLIQPPESLPRSVELVMGLGIVDDIETFRNLLDRDIMKYYAEADDSTNNSKEE